MNTKQIREWLFSKEDAASLCAFRILWGLVMLYESSKMVVSVDLHFYSSQFLFGYAWTKEIVQLTDRNTMLWLVDIGWWCAILCILGFLYRPAVIFWSCLFTYQFLLDQSIFLNHYYLICLISLIMCLAPANRMYSFDSYFFNFMFNKTYVRKYWYFLLSGLFDIVYFYAAIAKLNWDWLRAEPMRHWLASTTDHSIPLPQNILVHWLTPYIFSYGGIIFDFLVIHSLRSANMIVFSIGTSCYFAFHYLNFSIFQIGVFPYLCIFSWVLFLNHSWPLIFSNLEFDKPKGCKRLYNMKKNIIVVFVVLFIVLQILIPLRWVLFVSHDQHAWTETANTFAWRMKLTDKQCKGDVLVQVGSNHTLNKFDPLENKHLTRKQYAYMMRKPELQHQYAVWLSEIMNKFPGLEERIYIRINASCSMNFRKSQPLWKQNVKDIGNRNMTSTLLEMVRPIESLSTNYNEQYPWNWDWMGILNGNVNMTDKQMQWLDINYNIQKFSF